AKRQYQWSDPRMGPIQKSQNTSAPDSFLQLRGSSALWFMRAAPALKLFRLTSLRCDMHFGSKESRALKGLELFFWGYRTAEATSAKGAGKTTMVQHILKNREGLKVGVVVNDVAEVNIDSEVLKFEDADGIVGLQNGCACCSGRADLFARLQELVESSGITKVEKPWDRLVVECSGVAEPESIAAELEDRGRNGDALMKRLFLAGIICVVDASAFWEMYNSGDQGDTERKPLSALLVSQLESSDTVIINKTDLVSSEELTRVSELLKALSPNARQFQATRGQLPLRTLLPAEPIDLEMPAYVPTLPNRHSAAVRSAEGSHASNGHHHDHAHNGEECSTCTGARHERFGISSFVYRCHDRSFHPERLATIIRRLPVVSASIGFVDPQVSEPIDDPLFAGVLRSKGFVRSLGSDRSFYWSWEILQSGFGDSCRLCRRHAGRRVEVFPASASSKGQEVVFIGTNLDRAKITAALDASLATDAEAAKL
ncbi:unnamed protein product, partial [Cladocopium goreaui]